MDKLKQLSVNGGLELRSIDGSELPVITGYAAVFNQPSELLYGKWYEVIEPGYFDEALKSPNLDLRFFSQHNKEKPVARLCPAKGYDSLRVSVDSYGLRFEFTPINTIAGRDMLEEIRSGVVDGCSIGHYCAEDEIDEIYKGYPLRRLKVCAKIEDMSTVTYPAWPTTAAALRALCDMNQMTEEDLKAYIIIKGKKPAPSTVPLSLREKEIRLKMIDSDKSA